MKMIQQTSKSATKNDIFSSENFEHFLRSLGYLGHTLIAGSCIVIEHPYVCLALYFVKGSWILLFSSAGI